MCTLVRQTKVNAARKEHECMASVWIHECGLDNLPRMNFSEYRAIINAKLQGWKILKGQPYIHQFLVDGGSGYVFKARPEIHAICLKYDFYPEC